MNLPMFSALAVLLAALSGCSSGPALPTPDMVEPAHDAADALPVVLTDPSDIALQDQISGRLMRLGPCLYLQTGARSDLILWGDAVVAAREDEDGWLILNETTEQGFREADWLVGRGGPLPEELDLEAHTPQEVPFACERTSAIHFHSVRLREPPDRSGRPPDPPPPPRPGPSIIESVRNAPGGGGDFPTYEISGSLNPRVALFVHVVGLYRAHDRFGGRPICLTDADAAVVARIRERYADVHPDTRCDWDNGGVIFKESGDPALYVHAKIERGRGLRGRRRGDLR